MAMIPSSASFSSFSYGFTYDVFLSFRGTDTRYSFTGNLYKALCDSGVRTFIDDRELHGGCEITKSLVKAIKESRIFIPIFSINYASSSFCLDELVHIIHCFKEKGCLVLPIFYDVEPSHVRHQTESYGEAIATHEKKFQSNIEKYNDNMKRLQNWKMALNQAANLSGNHFNPRNGYEYEFIRGIVKYVSNKINRSPLHVADYPVGLQCRVLKVYSLLDVVSNVEAKMVGIYGPGGMGKTTLAKAVCNFIVDQFECVCFLHNVRENSEKHGLEHLQKDFLSKTIGLDIKLGDSSEGIPIIKQRLHRKKVLLILDDVDKLKQLQVLAGGLDWFSVGSRVIITTRDKHLLISHGIEATYEIDELNKKEALELLRWMAFKSKEAVSSYEQVLNRAVNYAAGLPLALEILGSNLFGKHIEEWNSKLNQYERIPDKDIQKILKVSFDSLEEDEQSVFLDIACCFKRYKLKEVEDMLCAHYGHCMKYPIGVLFKKSLLKFSDYFNYYVTMHDLIEDMGKEIVRQESVKEPGVRSRLWFHEDIFHVLEENSGTSQIEIIQLDLPLPGEIVEWKGDEFKKMKNLKTLIVKTSFSIKPHVHLPNSLRVLEWPTYSLEDIPSDFLPKNLSICKLPNSSLTSFKLANSLNTRMFLGMKVLRLDNSESLTEISDISALQNLEEFSFQKCINLDTVHDSVGFLKKLKNLNAFGCSNLRSFPPIQSTCLQYLELSLCKRLANFPEILGEIENIKSLMLVGTSIEELPDSFGNLTRLQHFALYGHGILRVPSSFLLMPKMQRFDAAGYHILPKQSDKPSSMVSSEVKSLVLLDCNLTDQSLPIVLTWFANVRDIDLSRSIFTILPECMKELRCLRRLSVENCKHLQEIRAIPPNFKVLSARNCESLSSSCRSMLLNQELHEVGRTMYCFPGTAMIPEWFEYDNRGSSISFWFRNKIPNIAIFCTTEWMDKNNNINLFHLSFTDLSINGNISMLYDQFNEAHVHVPRDHTCLFNLRLEDREGLDHAVSKNEWNHAEITYLTTDSLMMSLLKKCRIHIFNQESSMEDIQFTNPYQKRKIDDADDDDVFYDDDDDDDDDVFYGDEDDDHDDVFYDDDDVDDDNDDVFYGDDDDVFYGDEDDDE